MKIRSVVSLVLFLTASSGFLSANDANEGLRTLSLEECYDLALRSDESVLKAYLEVHKADLEPWSALTRLGPTLTGNVGLSKAGQSSRGGTQIVQESSGSYPVTTETNTGNVGITFQQPILDLTAIPAYRRGKLTAQAARLTYRYTIRQVLFGLAKAYYQVLKDERIVAVSKESLQLAEGQASLAQYRLDAGDARRTDVLNAQVTVETDRQQLIQAENTLSSDQNKLLNILGLPPEMKLVLVAPPDRTSSSPNFDKLLASAVAQREDLQTKRIAIDQNVESRNEVRAGYAPKLVAGANAGYDNYSGSSSSRNTSWDMSISVQMPFLTGGQREIDLRTARYSIDQARLDYRAEAKIVEQDVKDAWLSVRTLEASLNSSKVQVDAAQQSYQDTQAQYRAGTATSIDALNALTNLNIARRDLANNTYDYQVALRNVEYVSGAFQQERVQNLKFK